MSRFRASSSTASPTSPSSAAASRVARARWRWPRPGSVSVCTTRERVAGGASGRNGGFALRGGAAPYPVMVEAIGQERARALWRWTEEAVAELAALAGDSFRPTGSLRLAVDETEREELAAEHDALRADGFACEWRDPLPPPLGGVYPGAIFHPPDGVLQPARLVRRLAARAAAAGVEIREHTRVGSREETGAETVVVATDGYPSGLLGELEGLIVPTRGQVIATEPVSPLRFEIPHYGRHGFDYWHQTGRRAHRRRRVPRRLARLRVHGRRGHDAGRPGSARALRHGSRRTAGPRRLPLGGDLRPGLRLPPRRRPGAGAGRHLGRGRLLGTRERARLRVRQGSSRGRFSATGIRCSTSSSRHGSSSTSPPRARAASDPARPPSRMRPSRSRGPGSRVPSSRRA